MAWIRQLPSGLWAATVYTPAGRITESHRLKGRVEKWAQRQEDSITRGEWIDPRGAKITVGELWEKARASRHLERASRLRDESHYRCHVKPKWAKVPVGAILKPDVSKWVVEMDESHKDDCRNPKRCPGCRVGAATIEGAVGVLRAILDHAIDSKILRENAARGVKKPPRDAHVDRVLEPDEEAALLDALDRMFPGRDDARPFVELLAEAGMRWEEAAAIPPELIDTRKQRINIAWVMERDGTARPYAKSDAGNRPVTYGDHLAPTMRQLKLGAREVPGVFPEDGPTRLVFVGDRGAALRYSNWHKRVWVPALTGLPERPKVQGRAYRPAIPGAELDDPQPTPHDLRHTFGTGLADENVPIHDIMALMGHGDIRSAQRYLHSREERFDRARAARKRARQG